MIYNHQQENLILSADLADTESINEAKKYYCPEIKSHNIRWHCKMPVFDINKF